MTKDGVFWKRGRVKKMKKFVERGGGGGKKSGPEANLAGEKFKTQT